MNIVFTGYVPQEHARRETLLHVANGYLGMRASFEEGSPSDVRSIRGTYLNGFYETSPIHYEERLHGFAKTQQSIVNVMDVQGMDIHLDGEAFGCHDGLVENFEQKLDMEKGIYTRSLLWTSPRGKRTKLVFERMASQQMSGLILLRLRLTPLNWSGSILLSSSQHGDVSQDFDPHDPRKASVGKQVLSIEHAHAQADRLYMRARTKNSQLQVSSAVGHVVSPTMNISSSSDGLVNRADFSGTLKQDQTLDIQKFCVFSDSRRQHKPDEAAKALLEEAIAQGYDHWTREQQQFLDEFWAKSKAGIEDDEQLNASLAYSMYGLLSSAGRDGIGNIASKGLSGEGYEGHYFWDTEIYMFPFILLTRPEDARHLLRSRAAMLEEAFAHARDMGHKRGALYPWRTITGLECSAYFPSGSAQYHINGAIAHAFITYWRATRDVDYMLKEGARVLVETARLWMDAGHFHQGSFRINSVTGPDEYSCVVNNNYYTNRSAQFHLRGLLDLIDAFRDMGLDQDILTQTGLSHQEMQQMQRAADAMYLPYDEQLGISAQDDAFLSKAVMDFKSLPRADFPLLMNYHPLFLYRHQVCKQADTVLSHFLFEEGEDEAVISRSYDYYENITTHDSSLSECVFSMMAARVHQTDKAYDYYIRSANLDLLDTHGNTADGIHAANMGGCWMGISFGFSGLRLNKDHLAFRPVLPRKMAGYSYTITWLGSRLKIRVDQAGFTARLLSGPALRILVDNKAYLLDNQIILPLAG